MTIELPILENGRSNDTTPGGPPEWARRMETQGGRAALRRRDGAGLKVCLISLANIVTNPKRRYHQVPPMGVAYLAASAREAGHEVAVVDALGEALDAFHPFIQGRYINGLTIEESVRRIDPDTDVICVSVTFSSQWPLAQRLLIALRQAFDTVPLVAGGEHVSALTDHVFESTPVDYAVTGEGEETFVELLAALSEPDSTDPSRIEGLVFRDDELRPVRTPPRPRRQDLDSIPWPAWDLIPVRRYMELNHYHDPSERRVMTMLGTRGCPYKCKFCSNPQMWMTSFYMRDPKDIVDEMECYIREYGASEFQFQDMTFVIKKQWVVQVAEEIISRGLDIKWKLPSGTRSEAFDAELLTAISASGCSAVSLAPETGSRRVAEALNKPLDMDQFLEIGRIVRRHRIRMVLNAYLIVGTPEERLSDLLRTYVFLVRLALAGYNMVGISKFLCYPGSVYHQEFLSCGQIDYNDDYFLSLTLFGATPKNGRGTHPCWSEHQIKWFIRFGYLLFFSVQYFSRPMRMVRSVVAVLRNKPTTRFEALFSHRLTERIHRLWRRWRHRRSDIMLAEKPF